MRLQFQKGDWLAIAAVLMLAVLVAVAYLPKDTQSSGQVQIYQEGVLVHTMPLNGTDSYTVVGEYTNVIRVDHGTVSIVQSDCPGKDCVHSGEISASGRSLVCLPNSVEVRIVAVSSDVDFVVG